MQQGNARTKTGTRTGDFTIGAAVATAASVFGLGVNIAAGSPLPTLVVPFVSCGVLWLAALTKWARTTVRRDGRRFAGTLAGVALTLGTAMMSRSLDLTPAMALPVPYAELSPTSAEVLYGKARPVTPLPIQSRTRSFLSHTHEPPAFTPNR